MRAIPKRLPCIALALTLALFSETAQAAPPETLNGEENFASVFPRDSGMVVWFGGMQEVFELADESTLDLQFILGGMLGDVPLYRQWEKSLGFAPASAEGFKRLGVDPHRMISVAWVKVGEGLDGRLIYVPLGDVEIGARSFKPLVAPATEDSEDAFEGMMTTDSGVLLLDLWYVPSGHAAEATAQVQAYLERITREETGRLNSSPEFNALVDIGFAPAVGFYMDRDHMSGEALYALHQLPLVLRPWLVRNHLGAGARLKDGAIEIAVRVPASPMSQVPKRAESHSLLRHVPGAPVALFSLEASPVDAATWLDQHIGRDLDFERHARGWNFRLWARWEQVKRSVGKALYLPQRHGLAPLLDGRLMVAFFKSPYPLWRFPTDSLLCVGTKGNEVESAVKQFVKKLPAGEESTYKRSAAHNGTLFLPDEGPPQAAVWVGADKVCVAGSALRLEQAVAARSDSPSPSDAGWRSKVAVDTPRTYFGDLAKLAVAMNRANMGTSRSRRTIPFGTIWLQQGGVLTGALSMDGAVQAETFHINYADKTASEALVEALARVARLLSERKRATQAREKVEMHQAASCDKKALAGLLASVPDVEARNEKDHTPFMEAALAGADASCLEILLWYGADEKAVTKEGWNALHLAVSGDFETTVLSTLIRLGVDPRAKTTRTVEIDGTVYPAGLDVLSVAVRSGAGDQILSDLARLSKEWKGEKWIDLGNAMDARNERGIRLAFDLIAANRSRTEALQSMAGILAQATGENWKELVLLTRPYGVMKILREENNTSSDYSGTLLHQAVENKDADKVETLLQHGFEPDIRGPQGNTPLHLAASQCDARMIALLTRYGASTEVKNRDYDRLTPLQVALECKGHEVIQLLLEAGADPNGDGGTYSSSELRQLEPLHRAFHDGDAQRLALCLRHGARVGNAVFSEIDSRKPDAGKLELLAGVVNELDDDDKEGVRALLFTLLPKAGETGKNLLAGLNGWSSEDSPIATALCWATGKGDQELTTHLLRLEDSLAARCAQGQSLLHLAVAAGDRDFVAELLDKGANVDARDEQGNTPLHLAAGSLEVAELLLKYEADAAASNKAGQTPLHVAAATGNRAVVQLLTWKGASKEVRDKNGQTPADVAVGKAALVLGKKVPGDGDEANQEPEIDWCKRLVQCYCDIVGAAAASAYPDDDESTASQLEQCRQGTMDLGVPPYRCESSFRKDIPGMKRGISREMPGLPWPESCEP